MVVAAYTLLILFSIVGFIAIFLTSSGTWLIALGALIFAFMTHFSIFDFWTLAFVLILYAAGEILEYVALVIGAKKFGASNRAIVGALLGGVFGAVLGVSFLGVGIIPGTILGIFLGALLLEYTRRRDWNQAMKAGVGSVLGRMGSIAAKVGIALMIYAVMAFKIVQSFQR